MSNLSYPVANSANWQLIWNATLTAPAAPGNSPETERFYPIPPTAVPVQLSSELVAFHASSTVTPPHWKFAATVEQKLVTGLTVGGTSDAIIGYRKIYLNQISLLRFPVIFGSSFVLQVRVPYWIRQVTLNCWTFTGAVTDSYSNRLDQIIANTT